MLSANIAFAEVVQTQSPIYTDDIGRMHFLGKGGYSSVRPIQMGEAYSNAVDNAVIKYSNQKSEVEKNVTKVKEETQKTTEDLKKEVNEDFKFSSERVQNAETDITKVIKEKPVALPNAQKTSFSAQKAPMDASKFQGNSTNIPSGVNDSKTIYTDDLGRLHFFGKGNLIKESEVK